MTSMAESKPHSVRSPEIGFSPGFLLIAAFLALPLSGCSSVGSTMGGLFGGDTVVEDTAVDTAASNTQAESSASGFVVGGSTESRARFSAPSGSGQGAPDLNSVPNTVPTPSPQAERDEALSGLIADRANARHSTQNARSMPVAVRPLGPRSDVPAENAEPPPPEPAAVDPVTRLADVPPPRPAEAGGSDSETSETSEIRETPQRPSGPAAGPRQGIPALPSNSIANNAIVGTPAPAATQFLPLSSFDPSAFSISSNIAALPSVARGITPEDRGVLQDAANQRRETRGVLRVIAYGGAEPSSAAVLAVRIAEELVSLGVPRDRLYVGADTGTGPVEVLLDY